MKWDYAELSKMAKVNGGPEALVEKLTLIGIAKGKASMVPYVIGAPFVGILIWETAKFLIRLCKTDSEEELRTVKDEIIQGIKNYDIQQDENNAEDIK